MMIRIKNLILKFLMIVMIPLAAHAYVTDQFTDRDKPISDSAPALNSHINQPCPVDPKKICCTG